MEIRMARKKWLKNYHGNVTPIYECDKCDAYFKRVDNPSTSRPEEVCDPVRSCTACGHEVINYFASWNEFVRWRELLLLQKQGYIKKLQRQTRFPIKINLVKVFTMVSDFDYYTNQDQYVVEDKKSGVLTDVFKLKKKCFEAYYGVELKIS